MLTLKGLKIFDTFDGYAFYTELILDGTKIAVVGSDGNGAEYEWQEIDPKAVANVRAAIDDQRIRKQVFDDFWYDVDLDQVIEYLIQETETVKAMRRYIARKTAIPFFTPDMLAEGKYMTLTVPKNQRVDGVYQLLTAKARAQISRDYPGAILAVDVSGGLTADQRRDIWGVAF